MTGNALLEAFCAANGLNLEETRRHLAANKERGFRTSALKREAIAVRELPEAEARSLTGEPKATRFEPEGRDGFTLVVCVRSYTDKDQQPVRYADVARLDRLARAGRPDIRPRAINDQQHFDPSQIGDEKSWLSRVRPNGRI